MKFLGFNNAFCLSPHPDDIEIALSGTILKYSETIFTIFCFSIGSKGDITSDITRHQEASKFWKNIHNVKLHFSNVQFLSDKNEESWLNYIEKEFISNNIFDVLFIPSSEDSHFEHRAVSNIGLPLFRIKKTAIISYFTPSTQNNWIPNIFVNIDEKINDKINRLENFSTQSNKPYLNKKTIQAYHTDYNCVKRGIRFVEKLHLHASYF